MVFDEPAAEWQAKSGPRSAEALNEFAIFE